MSQKAGSLLFKKRVSPGGTVNYSIPAKEDTATTSYEFKGWKDEKNGSAFDLNTEVNENMKVYATWNEISKVQPAPSSEPDGTVAFSTNYGTIDVIWLDIYNNVIASPNDPSSHLAGMTKVTWTENADHSATEDSTADDNWYSYTAGTGTSDYRESRWANAKNGDKGYFVWIPRFAYRITYYNAQADRSDPSKITGYYDGYGQWRASDGSIRLALDDGVETVKYNGKKYIVHPAFTNDNDTVGSKLPFDLGGWDQELEGFWVAKYEMCRSDATASGTGAATTFKSLPNVQSARNITVGNCYTYSLSYDNGKQSHLMKNSEWGAVAYLTHSQYGRNGNEIDINNSSSYITGNGGNGPNASGSGGTPNAYNSSNGTKASTTGNVYGIYDLSGGAWDYVAAWDKASTSSYVSSNAGSFATSGGASTKYATAYSNGTSTYRGNSIITRCGKIGDATKEVNKGGLQGTSNTTEYYNWFGDRPHFTYAGSPCLGRGSSYSGTSQTGVFAVCYGAGSAAAYDAFRTVLCP